MGITTQTLMKERFTLQKTLSDMNGKIQVIEKEVTQMINNMNAVHGALQQCEKLIKLDAEHGRDDGTQAPIKEIENGPPAPFDDALNVLNKGSSLDIKPKEEAHLLNEKKEQEK